MVEKTCKKCGGTYDPDQRGGYVHVCPPSKDQEERDEEGADMSKENADDQDNEA